MKPIIILYSAIWMYYKLWQIQPDFRRVQRLKAAGNLEEELEAIKYVERKWAQPIIEKIGIKINVTGAEHIPDGPVAFVSNHQGDLDIMILIAGIDHQMGFVAKKELQKLPGFGSAISDIRSVFIDREDARASLRAIEEGVQLLNQGFSMTIFPEGTRSKGPQMGEFKKGSLRLATKAEVPVIPITINGSYKSLEETGLPKAATVDLYIHPPISTKGMPKAEANDLAERVERQIREKLLELQG